MADVVNAPDLDLQFFGNDGKPLASGYLKFFRNRTDIPVSVYTSDGETALGPSIQLDASGFPVVQFSLLTGQLYTVKAFDHDDVLIWTRNDISGSSEGGGAGNWVPMSGTSADDPITGPLVLKDDDDVNTTDAYGTTLTSELGGSTSLVRDGLTVAISNDTGEYGATSVKIQNTQNGFPGYPNKAILNNTSLTITGETAGEGGVRVEKQLEIKPATSSAAANKITSKGNLTIDNYPSNNINIVSSSNLLLQGQSVEINPENSGNVIVGNGGKLITQNLGIGTTLNNKTINDIWTSTSTGTMTDDQLITAKAASEMGGGGGSDWDIVPQLQMRRQSFGTQFGVIMRAFWPLGDTVRSLALALAPYTNSYVPGGTLNGEIGIYTLSVGNGTLFAGNATRIAHATFSNTIVAPIVWASFDEDVDVSDKTKVYAAAISFDRPVANVIPSLCLDGYGTSNSDAYTGTHFGASSHISLAASMNFNQGGTGSITYWFGISSRNLG